MDLQEVWRKLDAEKLSKPVTGAFQVSGKSKHPIQKLKDAYLTTTVFSVVFLLGFIALFFVFPQSLIRSFLILVILAYVAGVVVNYTMYRKLHVTLPSDQSLKTVLINTYQLITKNILMQERAALLVYPIAAATGFFMGGAAGSGDLYGMLQKKIVIIALIVIIVVLTPACFYLARWMYKVSYGKCLKDLKERIDALEDPT
jgi:hypothetical protein